MHSTALNNDKDPYKIKCHIRAQCGGGGGEEIFPPSIVLHSNNKDDVEHENIPIKKYCFLREYSITPLILSQNILFSLTLFPIHVGTNRTKNVTILEKVLQFLGPTHPSN